MSEEEKKAIEDLKKKYTTEYLDDYEVKFMINYIEKQDKIIDLMADYIHLYTLSGEEDVYCFKVNDCEVVGGSKSCFDCIKEYFRKKLENE